MKVLLTFPHGLGDCCQATILLNHLKHYHPDWQISIITKKGRENIFYNQVENYWCSFHPHYWLHLKWDLERFIHFHCPYSNYLKAPTTKIAHCLVNEFQLEPLPELYQYTLIEQPEAVELTQPFIARIPKPYAVIHCHSEVTDKNKNLTDEESDLLIARVKAKGLFPVVVDFSLTIYNRRKDLFYINSIRPSPFDRWGNAQSLRQIIKEADSFWGIDSGIGHLAATTDIPVNIFWKETNPAYCFDPIGNLTNYVPANLFDMFHPDNREQAIQNFKRDYKTIEYKSLPAILNTV